MGYITAGQENSTPIELYYEDHGSGQPVVLIHGYPLDGWSWERQARELRAAGFRVITYDRRGFGRSSKVETGYDYDTFAGDLNAVLDAGPERCDRRVLDGHRRAGPLRQAVRHRPHREVRVPRLARARHASGRASQSVFDDIATTAKADRFAWFTDFYKNFYNLDENLGSRISQEAVTASWNTATGSAPVAAYAVVPTWIERTSRRMSRSRPCEREAHADRPRHLGQHPADRRDRSRVPRGLPRRPSTTRSTARPTACCGPMPEGGQRNPAAVRAEVALAGGAPSRAGGRAGSTAGTED